MSVRRGHVPGEENVGATPTVQEPPVDTQSMTNTTASTPTLDRKTGTPKGYINRWPHPAYDLFRKSDEKVAGPAWWVRCNEHTVFTAADAAKTGDALGSKTGRQGWCEQCMAARKATKSTKRTSKRTTSTPASDAALAEIREAAADAEATVAAARKAQPRRTTKAARARKATK